MMMMTRSSGECENGDGSGNHNGYTVEDVGVTITILGSRGGIHHFHIPWCTIEVSRDMGMMDHFSVNLTHSREDGGNANNSTIVEHMRGIVSMVVCDNGWMQRFDLANVYEGFAYGRTFGVTNPNRDHRAWEDDAEGEG